MIGLFRQIRLLTAAGFSNIFNFRFLNKKQSGGKGKKIAFIALFAFIGIYMAAISGTVTYMLYTKLFGKPELEVFKAFIPCLYFVLASALSLITGIFSSQGFLFKANDFDMLFSFPVSTKAILISKFLLFYFYELIFTSITIGVSDIVYMVLDGVTVCGILATIAGVFLTPLLPMMIGTLIAYGISLLIRNSAHKNQITTILTALSSVLIFVVIEASALSSENLVDYIVKNGGDLLKSFRDYYFPAGWYTSAFSGSFLYLLLFTLLNLIPLALLLLLAKNYRSLVASFKSGAKKAKFAYSESKAKTKSVLMTCFFKEFKKLFSVSAYILNSGIGIIMMLLFLFTLSNFEEGLVSDFTYYVFIAQMIFVCTIAPTTNCSVSLEAKTLWIYKTSPVNENTILTAKAMVNYVLYIPAVVIVSVIASIIHSFTFLQTLLLIALSSAAVLAVSYYGLLINLALPKFDWTNETQAIKQSSSVLVSMFTVMLFNVTFIGGSVLLIIFKDVSIDLLVGIYFILYLALYIVSKRLCATWGVKKFRKL